ncbi:putative porin [Rhodopseudomonas sp. RCAM05734]|uniref:putative porin n=1 Tax=Rhodopseudomonas sp. RCAM05734 TaxID=3457549 RepID=UPI004043CC8A
MFHKKNDAARRSAPLVVSMCALVCSMPALAQDAGDRANTTSAKRPAVSRAKPTSPNATINLVNMLVKQGVLKEDQAQALIKQADDEAYVAREAAKGASLRAEEAAKTATAAAAVASPPGTKHVTYVPEIVKRQLREEIKRDVMAKAQSENWASPGKYPEWAQRIRFYGDLRARYEGQFFPTGNDPRLVNFNAINTGSPYELSQNNPYFAPTLNSSQDRERARFRLRVGADIDIADNFMGGFRFASGDSNSPVSLNQTLGGNGGNFSKYSLWIDRAYLRYQPSDDLSFSVGRFDNPFWSPTDLVWYRDIGFDGFAAQVRHEVAPGVTPFLVAGAFPTFNSDLNVGYNIDQKNLLNGLPGKYASNDKWMFGVQAGVGVKFDPQSSFRLGVAYYDFTNTQGRVSSPCFAVGPADVCDTDQTRPSFAQKGNTYMTLRNILADTSLASPASQPYYQYLGLASQFRPVVVSGQVDLGDFHPVHVVIDGEYVNNIAFDRNSILARPVNDPRGGSIANNTAPTPDGSAGPFNGGNQGWMGRVTVGHKQVTHLWDWNVHAGYKYLESDAIIDAFADSDFGLGGTNLKGYFIGGNLGLSDNVWASLRWMSANNISGGPYAVDVVQVDLNAKF